MKETVRDVQVTKSGLMIVSYVFDHDYEYENGALYDDAYYHAIYCDDANDFVSIDCEDGDYAFEMVGAICFDVGNGFDVEICCDASIYCDVGIGYVF